MGPDLSPPKTPGSDACERLAYRTALTALPSDHGEFQMFAFGCSQPTQTGGGDHLVIMKGDVRGKSGVLLRIHSECLTGDVFGSRRCDCGEQLAVALRAIEKEGSGLVLYLRQEGRGIGLANKVRAYNLQDHGADTIEANELLGYPADLRTYHCAACALHILNVKSVRLMTNNPLKIEELGRYGVPVDERVPIDVPPNPTNVDYLTVKRERMGHLLGPRP